MTPASVARMIAREGQFLLLQRPTNAPTVTVDVSLFPWGGWPWGGLWPNADTVALRGVIQSAAANDLPGGNPQSGRQIRIAHQDAAGFGWPAPPRKGDRVVAEGGRAYVVQGVDQLHLRGQPALYVLQVAG